LYFHVQINEDFNAYDFRITAPKGKIELQLNYDTPYNYKDVSLSKWPLEYYYKVGNYLSSTEVNAFSRIKYYNLSITH
tara:strand:+ start:272 stop:505 length:234 start_codon:yes stop_codon:yes gene_type:complete